MGIFIRLLLMRMQAIFGCKFSIINCEWKEYSRNGWGRKEIKKKKENKGYCGERKRIEKGTA